MIANVDESDWRRFRRSVSEWRERYLQTVNEEINVLTTPGDRTPTEAFWEIKDRVDAEAKILQACLDGHSRSNMSIHLIRMLQHGMICEADLDDFSHELRDQILASIEEFGRRSE
ncbi:hypothetical protein [Longibacter sp.]|jgi:hypothetical protein|uniref:hypothetical protein n=1 Tax=Longibacter sp. TaxID=2045415 RepID=UPI003EC02087